MLTECLFFLRPDVRWAQWESLEKLEIRSKFPASVDGKRVLMRAVPSHVKLSRVEDNLTEDTLLTPSIECDATPDDQIQRLNILGQRCCKNTTASSRKLKEPNKQSFGAQHYDTFVTPSASSTLFWSSQVKPVASNGSVGLQFLDKKYKKRVIATSRPSWHFFPFKIQKIIWTETDSLMHVKCIENKNKTTGNKIKKACSTQGRVFKVWRVLTCHRD